MGRDKAHLLLNGQPLWRHQIETLRQAGASEIAIASGDSPAFSEAGCPLLTDSPPGAGPLGGLLAGLEWASTGRVLFLAVDLPGMPPAFLQRLAQESSTTQGIVPQTRSGYEPLAAVYPRLALPLAKQCAASGQFALQEFARRAVLAGTVQARPIAEGEYPYFQNLNTPDDWRNFLEKKY